MVVCVICRFEAQNIYELFHHNASHTPTRNWKFAPYYITDSIQDGDEFLVDKFMRIIGDLDLSERHDVLLLCLDATEQLRNILRSPEYSPPRRVIVRIKLELIKFSYDENIEDATDDAYFSSTLHSMVTPEDIDDNIFSILAQLVGQYDSFQGEGSGWTLLQTIAAYILVCRYSPVTIGCGEEVLPLALQNKTKSLVILQTNTQNPFSCFMYSVLAALYPAKTRKTKLYNYHPYKNTLIFPENTPVTLSDIDKFARINKVGVNVFLYTEKAIYPLRCERGHYERNVDLLMVDQHCFPITNLTSLFNLKSQVDICKNCTTHFYSKPKKAKHERLCLQHEETKVILPTKEKDRYIKFRDLTKTVRLPFFCIIDSESYLSPEVPRDAPKGSLNSHRLACISMLLIETASPTYRVVKRELFWEHLTRPGLAATQLMLELRRYIRYANENRPNLPLVMQAGDEERFNQATTCEMCEEPFASAEEKVHHHDHTNGRFLGALCKSCNRSASMSRGLPVFIHHLSYDLSHFIEKLYILQEEGERHDFYIIASSMERFKHIGIRNHISFTCTMQYKSCSLEKWCEEVANSNGKFACSEQIWGVEKAKLLRRKMPYPYTCATDLDFYASTQSLPDKRYFDNDLTEEACSEDDYAYAQRIWEAFNCQNFKDFTEVYVQNDCLILADCLIDLRETLFHHYQLDLLQFVSLPAIAFAAALKMTRCKIENLACYDMYLTLEAGKRGGVCQQSVKRIVANNENTKWFEPSMPTSHLLYIDANSLYPHAMSMPLPYGNYKWRDNITLDMILNHPTDAPTGYIVICDLEIDPALQSSTWDLPLCPANEMVQRDDLSPSQQELIEKLGMKFNQSKGERRLVLSCKPKTDYCVHYLLLSYFVSLGARVTRISRCIEFSQSRFFKSFIDLNISLRNQATSFTAKNTLKLCSNSVYGRSLVQVRKFKTFKLCFTTDELKKYLNKPHIKDLSLISNTVSLVHMQRLEVKMFFPIIVGFCILEHSKLHMYRSYYSHIRPNIRNVICAYTDTDSFVLYSHDNQNFTEELKRLGPSLFDFSSLPPNHPLYSTENKNKLGYFKVETTSGELVECVLLRPKQYSLRVEPWSNNESEPAGAKRQRMSPEFIKRAKGIKKHIVKRDLLHQMYIDILEHQRENTVAQTMIMSQNFKKFTLRMTKKALSCVDIKRHQIDTYRSVPHAYKGAAPPPLETFVPFKPPSI